VSQAAQARGLKSGDVVIQRRARYVAAMIRRVGKGDPVFPGSIRVQGQFRGHRSVQTGDKVRTVAFERLVVALCNRLTVALRRRYHDLGGVPNADWRQRRGERVRSARRSSCPIFIDFEDHGLGPSQRLNFEGYDRARSTTLLLNGAGSGTERVRVFRLRGAPDEPIRTSAALAPDSLGGE
jgi:hypothetical protein